MKRSSFRGLLIGAFVVLFLTITGAGVAAPEEKKESEKEEKIPVDRFVQLVIRNDPAFQSILVDELALKYSADLELPVSDFVLDTTAKYVWNPNRSGGVSKGSTIGDISLSKLFPSTGTTVSAGYSVTRTSSTDGTDALTGSLTGEISQSILENAFGSATRKTARKIGLENEIARHQIVEAYEDYLASLIQVYGEWLSAYENLKTANQSLASAGELVSIVQRKRSAGIAFPEELDQIRLEYMTAKENVILAGQDYDTILNTVQASLGSDFEYRNIIPVRMDWNETFTSLNKDDMENIIQDSRTFRMMALLEKQGMLVVDIAEDGLLPSASLFAGVQMTGDDYRMTATDRRAYAGFTFSVNFGNQVERATFETAKVDLKKTELDNRSSLFTLRSDLRSLNRQLEEGRELLDLAKEREVLAKRVYVAERRNYGIGKTDLNTLIEARDNAVSAGYQVTARLVELHRLQTEWLRLSDQLVSREKILDETPVAPESEKPASPEDGATTNQPAVKPEGDAAVKKPE